VEIAFGAIFDLETDAFFDFDMHQIYTKEAYSIKLITKIIPMQ
jgi:hypothetical protein